MTLQAPGIVLFDMDGTTVRHINPKLLGTLEFLDDCAHRFNRILAKKDHPILPVGHLEKPPRLLVHRALHRFRKKPVDQIVEPCPGVIRVLDLLKSKNITLGLVSNGLGAGYGHDILEKFDLEKYFDVTIFREDIQRAKPHPDPLLKALSGLRDLTEQDVIWHIGDRHKDVIAALAAREHLPCTIQPVAYGLHAAIAVLERHVGTEHIVMSYHDLENKIKKLTGE